MAKGEFDHRGGLLVRRGFREDIANYAATLRAADEPLGGAGGVLANSAYK